VSRVGNAHSASGRHPCYTFYPKNIINTSLVSPALVGCASLAIFAITRLFSPAPHTGYLHVSSYRALAHGNEEGGLVLLKCST